MANTSTPVQYRRASDYIQGLGENLDKIEGTDMLLHSFEVEEERPFGDGTSTLVTMQLSTIDDPEVLVTFHAWSDAIASRLREMESNDAKYPVIVNFAKTKTRRGFTVWTVK